MGARDTTEFKADEPDGRVGRRAGHIIAGKPCIQRQNSDAHPLHPLHHGPGVGVIAAHPRGLGCRCVHVERNGTFRVRADAHHTLALSNERGENGLGQGAVLVEFMGVSRPIGEPIVQHGPFVMTSKRDIQQAFTDFRLAANGPENCLAEESHREQVTEHKKTELEDTHAQRVFSDRNVILTYVHF